MTPGPHCPPIMNLKLDHNQFGSRGVNALVSGIQCNENLRHLQMKYCGIDKDGARALFELLIFSKSKLEILDITGNHLRNEGCKVVLNGVSVAKELKKIHLADNQFNEDAEMLDAIRNCMARNKSLARYDFQYNDLKDAGKYILLYFYSYHFDFFSCNLLHRYAGTRRSRQNCPCCGNRGF